MNVYDKVRRRTVKMKNNLGKIIAYFTIALLHTTFAHSQQIDSLVAKMGNKDVYIVLAKNMSPRIKGLEAKSIVAIGKPATPHLIGVLDDQNKGIAAHFVLSEIWKETWETEICCNIKYSGNTEILTLNGLEICFENDTVFATANSLKKNKIAWESRVKV